LYFEVAFPRAGTAASQSAVNPCSRATQKGANKKDTKLIFILKGHVKLRNMKFNDKQNSACCLLHAGFLLGLLFSAEN
jgi:hypothetical protein